MLSLQNVGRANVMTSPRSGTVALISLGTTVCCKQTKTSNSSRARDKGQIFFSMLAIKAKGHCTIWQGNELPHAPAGTCLDVLVSRAHSKLSAAGNTSEVFWACEANNAAGSLPLSVRRIAAISSCLGDVSQAMCFGKRLSQLLASGPRGRGGTAGGADSCVADFAKNYERTAVGISAVWNIETVWEGGNGGTKGGNQ